MIGAMLNLVGNVMNKKASDKYAGMVGQNNLENIKYQKKFAKNGITWRVNDAKRAGIHPLAALGAQLIGFQPQYLDGTSSSGYGNVMKDLGQDISNALGTRKTPEQKELAGIVLEKEKAILDGIRLDNENKKNNSPTLPGSKIIQGSGLENLDPKDITPNSNDGPFVNVVPKQVVPMVSDRTGVSTGISPARDQYMYPDGTVTEYPSEGLTELMEDNVPVIIKDTLISAQDWAKGVQHYYHFHTPEASAWRQKMREHWPAAPVGYEYRYDVFLKQWRLHKKANEKDNKFYYQSDPKWFTKFYDKFWQQSRIGQDGIYRERR